MLVLAQQQGKAIKHPQERRKEERHQHHLPAEERPHHRHQLDVAEPQRLLTEDQVSHYRQDEYQASPAQRPDGRGNQPVQVGRARQPLIRVIALHADVKLREKQPGQQTPNDAEDRYLIRDNEELQVNPAGDDQNRNDHHHDGDLADVGACLDALSQIDERKERPREALDHGVSPGDRRAAVPASATQHEETDKGDIVVPPDRVAAVGADGTRGIAGAQPPGKPPDAYVQVAAHRASEQEEQCHHGDGQPCRWCDGQRGVLLAQHPRCRRTGRAGFSIDGATCQSVCTRPQPRPGSDQEQCAKSARVPFLTRPPGPGQPQDVLAVLVVTVDADVEPYDARRSVNL